VGAVGEKVWADVTLVAGDAMAFTDRHTPPSPAVLMPFCHTMSVFPVASVGSRTMSLMLRLPVFGLSKPPAAVDTLIRSKVIEPRAPFALVERQRPRRLKGGITPPNGASAPMPITPPAVPTKTVPG